CHAHRPRVRRVPTEAGLGARTVARGAAEAAAGGGTRGGSVHLVLPRRARSGIRGDSRASVPVLPAPLGEPDPRGSGARPDEALPAVPPYACLLRTRRHAGGPASMPPAPLRRHPRQPAAPVGAA